MDVKRGKAMVTFEREFIESKANVYIGISSLLVGPVANLS